MPTSYKHIEAKGHKYTVSTTTTKEGRTVYTVYRNLERGFSAGKTFHNKADIPKTYPNLRGKV